MSQGSILTADGSVSRQYFGANAKIVIGSDAASNLGGGTLSLKETLAGGTVKTLKTYTGSDDLAIPDIVENAQELTLALSGSTTPNLYLALA